jgi:hypothetical protein
MAKPPKGNLAVRGFDYPLLEAQAAGQVQQAAARIRQKVKKTVEDLIAVGKDLLTVKAALPHGRFGPWLKAEFGWGERLARNFMSVAERFGPKTAIIADLTIQPTAAYLLAAPSAPDEARQRALERAEAGEQITAAVAKEILAETRKKQRPRRQRPVPAAALSRRLARVLDRYQERWNPKEVGGLIRQLREFIESLEAAHQPGKRKAKC